LVTREPQTGRIEAYPAEKVANLDGLAYPDFDDFIAAVNASALASRYRDYLELPFESSRGCWWGEASHCKFCGINALGMKFRSKSGTRLTAELDDLIARYDPELLAASDAILDRHYFDSVLPAIGRNGYKARISYEVKANLKRQDVAALAAAGVSEILPGIETFSTRILKLVGKGATIFDNLQCLRLAEEYGLKVRWYHMCGLPGEALDDYVADIEVMERIPHLQPPREIARFTLQRFTPYFNNAAASGIESVRALPDYAAVFPFAPDVLDRLAYHFDFTYADGRAEGVTAAIESMLHTAIVRWQRRHGQTRLELVSCGRGALIVDTRRESPVVYRLDTAASVVYRLLDRPQTVDAIVRSPEFRTCLDNIDPLAMVLGAFGTEDGECTSAARREASAIGARVVPIEIPLLGLTPDPVQQASGLVKQLDAAGLVIGEKDRYIAVALPRARTTAAASMKAANRSLAYDHSFAAALESLHRTLGNLGYASIARDLTDGAEPHDVRRRIRQHRFMARPEHVTAESWTVVVLFLLGQPVEEASVRSVLGDSVDRLLDLGLLASDPPWIRCERYAIIPLAGRLFVVSRLPQEHSARESVAVYVGLDTAELVDYALRTPARSILDLGCGGGLVGISKLLDGTRCKVVGVDICAEAIEAARVNAAMHGVAYDVRHGDLYAPVAGERFDLILADPPALALPDDLAFPVYGAGGPDGDLLFRRIVTGAPDHLVEGGRLVAITELQCPPGCIPFLDWSRQWVGEADDRSLRVEVRGARHLAATYHTSLAGALAYLPGGATALRHPDPVGRLVEFAAERRLRMGYWVHVDLQRTPGRSSVEIDWQIARAHADSRPRLAVDPAAIDARVQAIYGHSVEAFEPAFAAFLTRVNGTDSIADIARRLAAADDESAARTDYLSSYFADLATALHQVGLVDLEPQLVDRR
jgi:SAM-dependent methyltransferase